jgi:hypothetical protein
VWQDVTRHVVESLTQLSQEDLEAVSEQKFPIDDNRVLGGIAFLLHHESYHIG